MSLRNVFATMLVSSLILAVGCGGSGSSSSGGGSTSPTPTVTPSLYTENNDTTANAVLAYSQASNGSLTLIGTYPTGGAALVCLRMLERYLSRSAEQRAPNTEPERQLPLRGRRGQRGCGGFLGGFKRLADVDRPLSDGRHVAVEHCAEQHGERPVCV